MKATSGVLTYDDFASLQRVGNAVTETLRLKSAPIIVRATQQPLPIGNYTVCHSLSVDEHTPHSTTAHALTHTAHACITGTGWPLPVPEPAVVAAG